MYTILDYQTSISSVDKDYLFEYSLEGTQLLKDAPIIMDILKKYGGSTFKNGLFRLHTLGSSFTWTQDVQAYFQAYESKVICFGFDWMGRQFCVSNTNQNIVLIFDPATAKVQEFVCTSETFFDTCLLHYRGNISREELFKSLKNLYKARLMINECLGFKKYLFLGGKDEPANYEVADLEVYWEFNRQIYEQIRELPPNTSIASISIEE